MSVRSAARTLAPMGRFDGPLASTSKLPGIPLILASAGLWALFVLAFALPFELTQRPLLHAAGMTITNVKVVWYTVVLLAVATLFRAGAANPREVLGYAVDQRVPLILLVGTLVCCVLSTTGSSHPHDSLKWTVDLMLGAIVWLAIPMWLGRSAALRVRPIAAALVAGAALAAVVGLLEFALGRGFADSLGWFKAKPTTIGPYLRLSGTFEYANIAAGYFEVVLLVALIGWLETMERFSVRSLPSLAWSIAVTVLIAAELLTYSRGAWIGIAAVGATLVVGLRRTAIMHHVRRWWPLGVGLGGGGVLLAALLATTSSNPGLLRLTTESDLQWYGASFQATLPLSLRPGSHVTVPVRITNHGRVVWQARGASAYYLSYHWLYPSGKVAVFEGRRTSLPDDVVPGKSAVLHARILAPQRVGRYELVWDMVQEGVVWFDLKTGQYGRYPVQVAGRLSGTHHPVVNTGPKTLPRSPQQPNRGVLWAAALRMIRAHPLLGVGPDGYRLEYGSYARPRTPTWDTRIFANSLPLELWADLGLLGGTLLLGFVLTASWPAWRIVWQGRAETVWVAAMAGALAAFSAHGLVDYLLGSHAMFILFWLILGFASVASSNWGSDPEPQAVVEM